MFVFKMCFCAPQISTADQNLSAPPSWASCCSIAFHRAGSHFNKPMVVFGLWFFIWHKKNRIREEPGVQFFVGNWGGTPMMFCRLSVVFCWVCGNTYGIIWLKVATRILVKTSDEHTRRLTLRHTPLKKQNNKQVATTLTKLSFVIGNLDLMIIDDWCRRWCFCCMLLFFLDWDKNVWWHLEVCVETSRCPSKQNKTAGIWIISSDQVVKPFWKWVCSGSISSEDASGKSIEWRWMKNHTGPTDYNEQMRLFDCYCDWGTNSQLVGLYKNDQQKGLLELHLSSLH